MRLTEILQESITFGVSRLTTVNGKQVYNDEFAQEVDGSCWVCDGTGKEKYQEGDYDCGMCKGSGKIKEYKYPFEELNVANSNALAILSALGLPEDYVGAIPDNQLPAIRRKLIQLKNSPTTGLELDSHTTRATRVGRDENDLPQISSGPTIHSAGRSSDQISRYIDSLLSIIDFAQKNNATVTWS